MEFAGDIARPLMAACGLMIFLLVMRMSVCDASYGDSKCCVWSVSGK